MYWSKIVGGSTTFLLIIVIVYLITNKNIDIDLPEETLQVYQDENLEYSLSNFCYEIGAYNYESIDENDKKEIVYIIIKKSDTLEFRKYKCEFKDLLNIKVPKDSDIIVSLHSNITINSSWGIKHNNTNNIKEFYIEPTNTCHLESKNEIIYGWSERRYNCYIQQVSKAEDVIEFIYSNNEDNNDVAKEIKINLVK
jgi:hypothetical protein